jgi:membrane protein
MSSGERAGRRPTRKRPALTELSREQWRAVARSGYERFGELNLGDRAATLAYYGFLSLFPALIIGVALLALFGNYPSTYNSIVDTLREAAPGPAIDTIDSALRGILRNSGSAGQLLGIGLLVALISSSGATGAAIRALDAINGRRGRSIVRGRLAQLGLTLLMMGLFMIAFSALLLAGPLFASIADAAGLEESARSAVSLLRYPIGLAALLSALLLLYWLGPAGPRRHLSEHLPGAFLGALLWILASIGFSFYVSHFGSYDKTYGTIGAVIVLLVWIYVGNMALLIGALTNRELRRVRESR